MRDSIREEFRECNRNIKKTKTFDDSRQYWKQLYEKLDRDQALPDHKRLSVLKEIFDPKLLKRILKIIPLETEELPFEAAVPSDTLICPIVRKSMQRSLVEEEMEQLRIDFRQIRTKEDPNVKHGNMYLNFLRQPDNVASRWRPKPPITFTGMSLSEKCEATTLAIAREFVGWLKELGGDETTTLDVQVIMNLFEIGFNSHAADSLCVQVKELLSVPKSIALARDVPEASHTSQLYKQLYRDINSIKKQEDMFAFGTMLPIEMRQVPQKDNIALKWIQNKRVPENIASMAVVWQGIEHLQSTQGFCKWLIEHPQVEPPKFLEKAGLLGFDVFQKKRISEDSKH